MWSIQGCPRTYTSYRCYRNHVLKQRAEIDEKQVDNIAVDEDLIQDLSESESPLLPARGDYVHKDSAALFILKAKEDLKVSQLALDGLLDGFSTLCESQQKALSIEIKACLRSFNCSSEVVELIFKGKHSSPFKGLHTAL